MSFENFAATRPPGTVIPVTTTQGRYSVTSMLDRISFGVDVTHRQYFDTCRVPARRAGVNTGPIRAIGGTGAVVTAAGLVFAFTMISMAASDLRSIGQIGTNIGVRPLFDTLSFAPLITPSLAALLGRWFWWPQRIRSRSVRSSWPTTATVHRGDALAGAQH
jgi:hypothetical protein